MGQLPPKRRQVVRLPAPDSSHWPKGFRQHSGGECAATRLLPLLHASRKQDRHTALCVLCLGDASLLDDCVHVVTAGKHVQGSISVTECTLD